MEHVHMQTWQSCDSKTAVGVVCRNLASCGLSYAHAHKFPRTEPLVTRSHALSKTFMHPFVGVRQRGHAEFAKLPKRSTHPPQMQRWPHGTNA